MLEFKTSYTRSDDTEGYPTSAVGWADNEAAADQARATADGFSCGLGCGWLFSGDGVMADDLISVARVSPPVADSCERAGVSVRPVWYAW